MKKILSAIVLLAVLAIAVFLVLRIDSSPAAVSVMTSGTVVEAGENYLIVKGRVASENGEEQEITVNFSVDSNTRLVNPTLLITQENMESTEPFTPEVMEMEGSLAELPVGMAIDIIEAKGSLVEGGRARAVKIEYTTMEMIPPPVPPLPEPAV